MRTVIMIFGAVLLLCGCEHKTQKQSAASELAKWDFEEINWPSSETEKLWGSTNVHVSITVRNPHLSPFKREVYSRTHALSVLGEIGWDVVWVSPSGLDFILRRSSGAEGTFTYDVDIDYANASKARKAEDIEERARTEEIEKRTEEILHPHDDTVATVEDAIAAQSAADQQTKAAEEKRKKQSEAKTVKWLMDQAVAGDAYSQMRMGERYLKGDGVEKDDSKAREFLQKAAAQGNKDAIETLQSLAAK